MAYDELELDRIGDRKTAVFFIISDTTQTYNFLVALAFSQMFNLLCERADNVHGGRLPHHVRVLWDEAANTGQVPQLEKLVAVIRSREVSLCLLYLTYTRPLTEKQASDYELRPAPDNPDRPRPIAEQMKNAAKLAEADRGSEAPAPQRRQPDRGDR